MVLHIYSMTKVSMTIESTTKFFEFLIEKYKNMYEIEISFIFRVQQIVKISVDALQICMPYINKSKKVAIEITKLAQ